MAYFVKTIFFAIAIATSADSKRTIRFKNNCAEPMWIQAFPDSYNCLTYPLDLPAPGPLATLSIPAGETQAHEIGENGWGGLFVPNFGCDGSGENCTIGGSYTTNFDGKPYSYPKNGNTRIKFYFPPLNSTVWNHFSTYDIDITNGFYTPVKIVPEVTGTTNCLPLEFSGFPCPTNETFVNAGTPSKTFVNVSLASANPLQCLSPCAYIYGPDGPIHKHESIFYATYIKQKNVAYKLQYDNYCCGVGEENCKVGETEYYKGLVSASGTAATIGGYHYQPSYAYCYETWSTSYDVTISCPNYNKAALSPPSCGDRSAA